MIDFNNEGIQIESKFGGSEKKTAMKMSNGIEYMIKYPDPVREKKTREIMSYKNNQFSEHIGCQIFNACGIEVQETLMGYLTDKKGKRRIVTACRDFEQTGGKLYEMKSLSNQVNIDDNRSDVNIEKVISIIEEHDSIKDKQAVKDSFWDMFVVDALIANKDRHLGNWGLLKENGEMRFAPVYDCGSSLGAMLTDEEMSELLNPESKSIFRQAEIQNAISCYSMKGGTQRIQYHKIFEKPPAELQEAIKRVVPKIDIGKIHDIIDAVESMPEVRKEYLKKAVSLRYEQILQPAWKRAISELQRTHASETTPPTSPPFANQPAPTSLGTDILNQAQARADVINAARHAATPAQVKQSHDVEI